MKVGHKKKGNKPIGEKEKLNSIVSDPVPEPGSREVPLSLQDALVLLDAVAAISSKNDLESVAEEAAKQIVEFIKADACAISKWDQDTNTLTIWVDYSREGFGPYDLDEYPSSKKALLTGKPVQVWIDKLTENKAERKNMVGLLANSMLLVPLVSDGKSVGLIEIYDSQKERIFRDKEIILLGSLASEAMQAMRTNKREAGKKVAKQIVELLNVETCVLSKWDHAANATLWWVEYMTRGYKPFELADFPLSLGVLTTGRAVQVRIDDENADQAERELMAEDGVKSLLMVSLIAQERTIGLIEIYDSQNLRTFTPNEISSANLFAKHAGIAIERTLLMKDTERRAAELEALRQASLNVTASLDLEAVLDAILESTLGLLADALDAHIFLFEDEQLIFGAALWSDGSKGEIFAEPRPGGLTDLIAREGKAIVVPDISDHPLFTDTPSEWKGSIIGIPLRIGDRVVGVMNIAYSNPRQFPQDELRVINLLADQAALAIENARLHDLVSQQAVTDVLTELPNRRAFDQRLEDEVRRSIRYQHRFTLLLIDFDDFKRINDTYGHPVGDKTLHLVSIYMRKSIRDTDFLARIGGDEFAVILPETGIEDSKVFANKLTQSVIECPYEWMGENEKPITLSVGAASFPMDATNLEDLISVADKDLYKTKDDD
ncbi:MAG: sensor domain-containing diguanylate cyclase [Chloroflexi bacterium]|nr:sensor domain-containing diguanylate cyclase [Chloroflexota bacterium]